MTKTSFKIVFLICIFVVLFSGCKDEDQPIEATGPQKPTSEIEGFYEQQQIVSGGHQGSGLNLTDIKIEDSDIDEIILTLSFGQGSQREDKSVATIEQVPIYNTSFIKGINRMILTMEGVSFFSYKLYEEELANSIIGGIFAQRPVDSDESKLYININTDYAYKVQEINNQIIITIHEVVGSTDTSAYYITLDAYEEYSQGLISEEFSMHPTLCLDGENVLLISKHFSSKEEADKFVTKNNSIIEDILVGKSLNVIEIDNSSLPVFSEELGFEEIANTPIAYKDDLQITFSPLIVNGRFLCSNEDNTVFAYAQPNTIYGDQEGDSFSFEYLYLKNCDDGQKERLLDYQFISITDAQFSKDSKYLAFIEQNDVLRKLQILSIEDGKLYIPSEEGFGIDTASFVWDDTKNVLYAINGEFQSKQLLSYDLTDPENIVVNGVFEQEFSESILQMSYGQIYYANRNTDSMNAEICTVDIVTGLCAVVAEGNSFILSPDGSKIVVSDIQTVDDQEIYRLRYIDIITKEESLIYSGQIINNITWSAEGSRLYYSIYLDEPQNEQYPYALYYYDVLNNTSVYMMDTITSALYPSTDDDEVLLMCVFTYKNQPVPVTYIVK